MLIHDHRTGRGITRAAWLLKKARWEKSETRRRNAKRIAARSVMLALQRATDWRVANGTEVPF
jgi:hypothetical protein